jgi:SAM-dependent methyltransferase
MPISWETAETGGAAARAAQLREVSNYYRWLDRWVRWHRIVRRYSGYDTMTVHRLMDDPVTGHNGPLVVHDLMLKGLSLPPRPRILDAGCGYGGTVFDLFPKIGGNWLGRTISPIQIARARKEAKRRKLETCVRFELCSYDEPFADRFDLAIAIESMVHSANPAATVANIAGALKPGGIFVLVDDMPVENFPLAFECDLEIVREMWRCPVMPTERGWRAAFEAAGLEIEHSRDLSKLIYHRPVEEMDALIARDTKRASWLRWTGLRMIPQANIGGLMIERLAVQEVLEYRVLRGRKKS